MTTDKQREVTENIEQHPHLDIDGQPTPPPMTPDPILAAGWRPIPESHPVIRLRVLSWLRRFPTILR